MWCPDNAPNFVDKDAENVGRDWTAILGKEKDCISIIIHYFIFIFIVILNYELIYGKYLRRTDNTTLNKGRIVADELFLIRDLHDFTEEHNLELVVSH